MDRIRWLHLTDFHQGMKSQNWLWPQIRQRFFEDLTQQHARSGPWDLILFSGDMTQKGTKQEFDRFTQFLEELLAHIKALGSTPLFLAVPGNHDLQRPNPKATTTILAEWDLHPEIHDLFWDKKNSEYRKLVSKAFRPFSDWWQPRIQTHPGYKKGVLPGDYSLTVESNGIRLGIVGLNSAFLQVTGNNFYGKVTLGAQQFHEACGGDGVAWANDHQACLLITHHPPNWLSKDGQATLLNEIAPPGRFFLHLFGHMHEQVSRSSSIGGAVPRRELQGPALFGLEYFGETPGTQVRRSHGYSIGELERVEETQARLRFWPRKAELKQGGGYGFSPDTSFELENDAHTRQEAIVIRSRKSLQPQRKESKLTLPPFRVHLISTSTDLGVYRRQIAQLLTTTRGVQVHEMTDAPNGFDMVILLQAFMWEDGLAAQLWERAANGKLAFLSDPSSKEWPPFGQVEVDKLKEIHAFRQKNTPSAQFVLPREISEKVLEAVDSLLARRSGIEGSGLLDWERAYLKARLVVWTAGRTALSHIHLHDDEARGDLYSAKLYVALKATSTRWGLDKHGKFCKRKLQTHQDRPVAFDGLSQEPVELERWVAGVDLPRVVIVGSPGGGKTVFLTRLAAELAAARVGSLERWMSLNLEPLRNAEGATPIPIVLEATRIAKRPIEGPRTVADAMLDELSAAGVAGCDAENLLRGLSEGRYALLVDALDEIASSVSRAHVLDALKALGALGARIVITTRSARYTGMLAFGPEFEVVDVAPLDPTQIVEFCGRWTTHRNQDAAYSIGLHSAVSGLDDKVEASGSEHALTGSPLMLTAICMVYDKHHSLPDDRARLCEILVDDLCRSRRSEDMERSWTFSADQKRDLLQRIALAMQESGAQSWPEASAVAIARTQIPVEEQAQEARARRHLDWTADHTGLLRFQQVEAGFEEVRFWHRLFREFLAASRLIREDRNTDELVEELWDKGRLIDPFWEDVIRLLPRTQGVSERAQRLEWRLREYAGQNPTHEGRLFGLAAAAVVESRDLFPNIRGAERAREMSVFYVKRGASWPMLDRVLFLEAMGRIDPSNGDPRLENDESLWIEITALSAQSHKARRRKQQRERQLDLVQAFRIMWCPVTVQQYRQFVTAKDHLDPKWWIGSASTEPKTIIESKPNQWHSQQHHPNWPVRWVSLNEANAFCRWRTAQRTDGYVVCLPGRGQWAAVFAGYQHDPKNDLTLRGNFRKTGIGHCTPVGAFPDGNVKGLTDVFGNVWEWGNRAMSSRGTFTVYGGAYTVSIGEMPISKPGFISTEAPSEIRDGHPSIGFRCVLVPAKTERMA